MTRVNLFMREGCHLCDAARDDLQALQPEYPHRLVEVDIEQDPALLRRYMEVIPVVEVGPYRLQAPFDRTDLRVVLGAAQSGSSSKPEVTGANRARAVRLNQIVYGIARHWLALANVMVFLYVALPFLAPVLMKAGAQGTARVIYQAYSPLCHQLAFRSWFIFGEQPAYPRVIAGTSLRSFAEVTGLSEDDLSAAREFTGSDEAGFKVAICERDIAIYGGLFLGGLLFAILRSRLRSLPVIAWLIAGVLPIALDGGIQLLSSIFPHWLPVYESTPFMRTLTGGLFGVCNVWLAYPHVEESMSDTQAALAAKLSGAVEAVVSGG